MYETVIGLEVHCQLKTRSKIFCSCSTEFGAKPNANTCPVCLGLPGVLPVLNRQVVEYAITAGLALHCKIQKKSVWSRKNYFYPDLPKGYQISQYEEPICLTGYLEIMLDGAPKKIGITRIHVEEDAGKLIHGEGNKATSHVDLNRAGIPLIEIVSEPDLRSAVEAGIYLRQLRQLVRYCDISDGNMEEGSLRCDANVSIRPKGESKLGTKVELKNINSFKFVEKAIEYEVERQKACLAAGEPIVQETRLWNSSKNQTQTMRSKEDAHDYRYFPDPDLLPLVIGDEWVQKINNDLPELAYAKAKRFVQSYGLTEIDAGILTQEKAIANFFEESVCVYNQPKKIANWMLTEFLRELGKQQKSVENWPVKPQQLAKLLELIDTGALSSTMGKKVFLEMVVSGHDPQTIVEKLGLVQVSDTGVLEKVIDDIISANPEQVGQYKAGKDKVFGFFVGQTMKSMKGQANPQVVNEILKKKLS